MRGDDPSNAGNAMVVLEEFPACAGMIRSWSPLRLIRIRVPRMRGDDPILSHLNSFRETSFPACAGMTPPVTAIATRPVVSSPHARG